MRKWLICCYKSGMTDRFRCQYQFHLLGSGCLEGYVEKDSEAVSRSNRKGCCDQRCLGLGKGDMAAFVSCIFILTPKLGVGSGLFHGNPGLQRD